MRTLSRPQPRISASLLILAMTALIAAAAGFASLITTLFPALAA